MAKFNKINVLSIQLNNEMEASPHISPILALLPSLVAMMLYASFEEFVQGFQAMDSKAPESHKVHLVLAQTGSGKTTRLIAGMVRKYPHVLFVLCLPRVLACNVAFFLRSEYKLKVCVKNGKRKEPLNESTQVLITTYQSAANAFVSGKINEFACERQVSLIFDECHETCAQATLLLGVMRGLLIKHPKFLHSLICISATMDANELSKRFGGIDQALIQVSQIEAPAKSFEKGPTCVISISVGNFMEDEKDEQDDQDEQDPLHVMFMNYCSIFEQHVIQIIEESDMQLDTSSLVIVAGIKSANRIQQRLYETLVKGRKLPVIIWNTFVQSECPIEDRDLFKYHLIIIGSHMKLASSLTFRQCAVIFISYVMQMATPNLANSTTVLNLGLIPKSVEDQSIGRGNRDCPTIVNLFPIVFPDDVVHPPRLDYLPQEPVPKFTLEFIEASISGPAKISKFAETHQMTKNTAKSFFYSRTPVDILLVIRGYSMMETSIENRKFFKLSINVLRAIAHAATYLSNGGFHLRKNPTTVKNDTEFSRILGFFLLDIVNRIIDAPIERSDEIWQTFFEAEVDIKHGVYEIRDLILGDGLGKFTFNGKPSQVTPRFLSNVLMFTSQYTPTICPFFSKRPPKMYVMKPDDDTGYPTIGVFMFSLPVFIPFGTIITRVGIPLFPKFFIELPGGGSAAPAQVIPTSRLCAGGSAQLIPSQTLSVAVGGCSAAPAQVIPTSRLCAGGSAQVRPSQKLSVAAGGGSAQVRPSQKLSVAAGGGSAQVRPSQMLSTGGDSSAENSKFLIFVQPFRQEHVVQKLRDLMDCIPAHTEFTSESFLNQTKYPNGILPENIQEYQKSFKKVDEGYSLLTILYELGLMRSLPNGRYQRSF